MNLLANGIIPGIFFDYFFTMSTVQLIQVILQVFWQDNNPK